MAESVDTTRLKITDETVPEGTLIGFRCRDCYTHVFGPATFCQSCTSSDLEPADLGRKGTLYSFTVVRIPPAGWPGQVPYVLGQVELPSGSQVLAEVIDCDHTGLRIGLSVELVLQRVPSEGDGPDKLVYKWRPQPAV